MTEIDKLIIQLKAVREQAKYTFQNNPVGFTLTYGTYWEYVSQIDEMIALWEEAKKKTEQSIGTCE